MSETKDYGQKSILDAKGDIVLNRFTDEVVKDIKTRLGLDSEFHVYGGTTYMEWYKLKVYNNMTYPSILVEVNMQFALHKGYTNLDEAGNTVNHMIGTTEFPMNYGVTIHVFAETKEKVEEIKRKIEEIYNNTVELKVSDYKFADEYNVVKLLVDKEKTDRDIYFVQPSNDEVFELLELKHKDGDRFESKNDAIQTYYQGSTIFTRFPSVYYIRDYEVEDICHDTILQLRMLQIAETSVMTSAVIGERVKKNIDKTYKDLITKSSPSFFDTILKNKDYKQLKTSFDNGGRIDKDLFNTVLKEIVEIYPSFYDKVVSGWTFEQIRADIYQYADIYAKIWIQTCEKLGIPERFEDVKYRSGYISRYREGLVYYITKMVKNPYCTISMALEEYKEKLLVEEEIRSEHNREFMDRMENEIKQKTSSAVGDVLKTATGVAIGNKISQLGSSTQYKDFMGSAGCMYGKKKDGWTVGCDIRCPLYSKCSRGRGYRA